MQFDFKAEVSGLIEIDESRWQALLEEAEGDRQVALAALEEECLAKLGQEDIPMERFDYRACAFTLEPPRETGKAS